MPNLQEVQEMKRALRHIKRYPEKHDQTNWISKTSCGTAACMAGRVALLNGCKPAGDPEGGDNRRTWDMVLTPDGDVVDVETFAMEKLGLDDEQAATELFDGANTVGDLERIILRYEEEL